MKIALIFLALLTTAFATQDPVGILGFEYIRDQKAFAEEGSKNLSPERQRALKVAKTFLALYFDAEIQGRFTIAEAPWGFQVVFTQLKTKKDRTWIDLPEGFGEIFLSKSMDRIRIDHGP
jgi:hypothetical protein